MKVFNITRGVQVSAAAGRAEKTSQENIDSAFTFTPLSAARPAAKKIRRTKERGAF